MSASPDHAPHSLDAERAVLSALLMRPDAWTEVRDIIGPDDFWRAGHQAIFRRMEGLMSAGLTIDLVTLSDSLLRHGELDDVGGLAYITRCVDGVAHSRNAVHYAELVRDYSRRRQCLSIAEQLRMDASGAEDIEEARARAEQALRGVDAGRLAAFASATQAAHQALDDLEAAAQAEHGVTGVATGFHTLDRMLGGLQPGDLVVLAARPSVGKTAAAGQVAMHAALTHRRAVLFVTLEQRAAQIAQRMASNLARVDLVAVREHQASEEDVSRLHDSLAQVADAPLTFLDSRDLRMSDVRRHARLLRAQGKCDLLVLDYLTLLQPERSNSRSETREAQVAAQSRMAKSIARELGVPFVLLCQLNREFERDAGVSRNGAPRTPRRPRLSDLRESGAIEQDADVVLFIHRPYVRPETLEERMREGETDLIVAKNRNGPIGRVRATYEKAWVRFSELTYVQEETC